MGIESDTPPDPERGESEDQGAFDCAAAAEEFVRSISPGTSQAEASCPKPDCPAIVCALRDKPDSPEAANGCPIQLDPDGNPFPGAF